MGHAIHFSLVCICTVPKMTVKTGLTKPGQAGLFATAMRQVVIPLHIVVKLPGHVFLVCGRFFCCIHPEYIHSLIV